MPFTYDFAVIGVRAVLSKCTKLLALRERYVTRKCDFLPYDAKLFDVRTSLSTTSSIFLTHIGLVFNFPVVQSRIWPDEWRFGGAGEERR